MGVMVSISSHKFGN